MGQPHPARHLDLFMGARMEALRSVKLYSLPSLLSDSDGWWERLRSGINV
jgi:hypothetical protein